MTRNVLHASFYRSAVVLLAGCAVVLAQAPPPSGGWRRVNEAPPPQADRAPDQPDQRVQADAFGQPLDLPGGQPPQGQRFPQERGPAPENQPAPPPPPELVLAPGTFITVRLNQGLSSDRNQPGDPFSAILTQPIVIDGVVVAQRGQMVYGRVAEAEKSRSSSPSRLGLELTGLTLVDGTQAPVRSQLVARQRGRTPAGDQVGTVATTTAVGAAIGAAADWGRGAAIGAGAGAAAGIVGVMLTRNHATVVYPETALTFRIESPLAISTVRAPLAFRYVDPYEYDRPDEPQLQPRPQPRVGYYGPAYGPAYGPYGPSYYPYRWGPGISLVFGGGYYRGGYYGGYGRYRRWR